VIAGVRKSQLAESKRLNADQVVALDDDAALGALAPVAIVANTIRGAASELLFNKVKDAGVYASVTGVPDVVKSHPSVRTVAFISKQDPKTMLTMAEAVRDGKSLSRKRCHSKTRDRGTSLWRKASLAKYYCSPELVENSG
jgi:hypothetical protein